MKLKKVALLSLTLIIFCLSVVLPVKAASPYNWKKYNYFVEDDVLYSMDGSTDIVVNEGDNVRVHIGSKVVLDSKEEPYKTTYIADPGREFGSVIVTNGKKGVVERWYNMEPVEPADRYSLKVDVLDKFELGKNVRYRITFKNDFDFTMRGVVLKCWLDSYTDHISNDKGGVNDSEDPKGIWFWFEEIKPGETININGLVKCVKDLPDGIKPAISARIMTMKRPAFKEATPDFIAMNTKEVETQQKVDEVISVGTKPKTEHVVIPHKKLEPKAGFEIIPGKDGSKDIVTTYTVDPKTGKVTPKVEEKNLVAPVDETYKEINYTYEGDPKMDYGKERKDDTKRIIYKGIKPKTEHVVIPHKKLEPKAGFEIIPGKDGSKDVVTTYTVDKQTGKVTPKVEEKNLVAPVDETYKAINYTYEGDPKMDYGKERKDDTKRIIYKGIKPKTEHVVIPHKKLKPKAGFEIIPGKDGSKDIVTTYMVDKQTGKVTPKTEEKNLIKPVDEQYRAKQTNKPTSTTKPNKAVKKPTKTNPPVRIINNNVNQVKVLPNTEAVPYR